MNAPLAAHALVSLMLFSTLDFLCRVTVELDANHAIEVTSEDDGEEEEEDIEVGLVCLWELAELRD